MPQTSRDVALKDAPKNTTAAKVVHNAARITDNDDDPAPQPHEIAEQDCNRQELPHKRMGRLTKSFRNENKDGHAQKDRSHRDGQDIRRNSGAKPPPIQFHLVTNYTFSIPIDRGSAQR
jgi:hypothetical protein